MPLPMPKNLTLPKPSSSWLANLKVNLTDFAGRDDPLLHVVEMACPGPSTSHRVYVLGLQEIAAGGGVEKARSLGWRFLAGGHPGEHQAVGCQTTDDQIAGLPAKVIATSRTQSIADLLNDFTQLVELRQLKADPNHTYELRVLRVAGLYLEAFWLKAPPGAQNDWIVPYGLLWDDKREYIKLPGGVRLNRMEAIRAANFVGKIKDCAQKRLADASARPPGLGR